MDWLGSYLEYCEPHEAPRIFHKWIGLSAVAACLERRVWLKWSEGWQEEQVFTVYPYLYVLLVAESGLCRKTSAIHILENLIQQMVNPPKIWAEQTTKEALISHMAMTSGSIYLVAPELTTFLDPQSLNSGLLQVLTRLYDAPDEFSRSTLSRGQEVVHDVCVNMLAATTPSELRRVLPQEAIGGGFMSRLLFVYGSKPSKRNPLPALDTTKAKELVTGLDDMRRLKGPVALSSEALEFYNEWYMEGVRDYVEEQLDGFESRRHIHVLKVAICLCCSQGRSTIDVGTLQRAVRLVDEVAMHASKVLRALETTPTGSMADRVLAAIRRRGDEGIQRSRLLQSFSHVLNARDLAEVVETLVESGYVRMEVRGKRGTWYVAIE